MTTRKDRMENLLRTALSPSALEIIDDSHKHAGHAGARPEGETHFTVRVESSAFEGLSRVQQHQKIYAILAPELQSGLHALSIISSVSSKK